MLWQHGCQYDVLEMHDPTNGQLLMRCAVADEISRCGRDMQLLTTAASPGAGARGDAGAHHCGAGFGRGLCDGAVSMLSFRSKRACRLKQATLPVIWSLQPVSPLQRGPGAGGRRGGGGERRRDQQAGHLPGGQTLMICCLAAVWWLCTGCKLCQTRLECARHLAHCGVVACRLQLACCKQYHTAAKVQAG